MATTAAQRNDCAVRILAVNVRLLAPFDMTDQANHLQRFADAAADYCAWCDGPDSTEANAARSALRHLLRLYLLALELREQQEEPAEAERMDHEAWAVVFHRVGTRMPFSYYRSVLDLRDPTKDGAGLADLGDDLADIYRDLHDGLTLMRSGRAGDAEACWAESFRIHWGRHATSATHALHDWIADERQW